MKKTRLRRSTKAVITLALPVLLVALLGPTLVQFAILNAHNVQAMHALSNLDTAIDQNLADRISATQDQGCQSFPEDMLYLHKLQNDPNLSLQLIAEAERCWPNDRKDFFVLYKADSLWSLGKHSEVCILLTEYQVAPKLAELLKRALDQKDWPTTILYLNCLAAIPPEKKWTTRYVAAAAYYGLGRYYEDGRQVDLALENYDLAAKTYPVVWAQPYIAAAQIRWQRGQQELAIKSLLDALSISTDVTATFNLWLQVGNYWEVQGKSANALCAYSEAQKLFDNVPANNVSEKQRSDIEQHIHVLMSSQGMDAVECNQLLATQ